MPVLTFACSVGAQQPGSSDSRGRGELPRHHPRPHEERAAARAGQRRRHVYRALHGTLSPPVCLLTTTPFCMLLLLRPGGRGWPHYDHSGAQVGRRPRSLGAAEGQPLPNQRQSGRARCRQVQVSSPAVLCVPAASDNASLVLFRVFGPGIEDGVEAGVPTQYALLSMGGWTNRKGWGQMLVR